MEGQDRNLLPQADGLDSWHAAIKALFSSLPMVGGVAGSFYDLIIAPPLTIRRDAWFQALADDIARLQDQYVGFDPVTLPENELFVSTVMQTTQMALRTHQAEKLEALRNVTLHAAVRVNIDETIQAMFLGLIDRFTPLHLQLLWLLNDPRGWARQNGITYPNWYQTAISQVIEAAMPDLRGQGVLCGLVGKELFSAGLIDTEGFNTMMTTEGALTSRTTILGKQFLSSIVDPVTGAIP